MEDFKTCDIFTITFGPMGDFVQIYCRRLILQECDNSLFELIVAGTT